MPDGREAYTRAGDLRVDTSGQLRTGTGLAVLGEAGRWRCRRMLRCLWVAMARFPSCRWARGRRPRAEVGRIKLVNPANEDIEKGQDGLFRMKDGSDAPADATHALMSGVLESSNVNVADAMVNMIELSRRFDMQVRAMRTAEDNGAASARLLSMR